VNKLIKFLLFIMLTVLMTGCASLRKAQLASENNPQQAVAEVTQVMTVAQQSQFDVLADEEFTKGSTYLADAKRGLNQGELVDTIVANAAIAKAFFQDAEKTANARSSSSSRILKARASALGAGVRKSDPLVEIMLLIDEDLKYETKQFSRTLSPEDFAELQKRYLVLEAKAVQFSQLNSAKKAISQAMKDDADDLAPKSLRTASLDYEAAMNIIAQSPRSPAVYKNSVNSSLASATQLRDVMSVILGAQGTPEHIAVQIVKQKRALGEMSTTLKTAKQSLGEMSTTLKTAKQSLQDKEGELKRTEGVLKTQEQQLARASTQVRFQKAMDEAREVLSDDDALVYQQGNKLVFRLKRVNFKSGTAVIPESSKQLISKVDAIIKKMDAEKVVVQGHTDSVGSAEINKKLSVKRASAVANHLVSLRGGYKLTYAGFGEAYPIVSNDTVEGRATNRRGALVLSVTQ